MKLIDADEIRYTSLKDGFGRIKECIAFSTDIEKMPTVDAIPIDWLLNQLLEEDLIETHHTICCLWEKWEKENE